MSSDYPEAAMSPARLREKGMPYWEQLLSGGLFSGFSPIASGTVGSAIAALVYFIPGGSNPFILLFLAAAAFAVGMVLAGRAEKLLGPDPSFFTLDEFAGQWLTLASPLILHPEPLWPVFAFLCFRVFDIAKTWPANWFDRRGGALGIMADDIVAAVYANICAHLIWYALSLLQLVREFLSV